jgi:hypothetical protein
VNTLLHAFEYYENGASSAAESLDPNVAALIADGWLSADVEWCDDRRCTVHGVTDALRAVRTLLHDINNEAPDCVAEHTPETVAAAIRAELVDGYPFRLTEAGKREVSP